MIWVYLEQVSRRALSPAVRVTDGLQIASASALPAVGKFLGLKMPYSIGTDALSYIGAAAMAFIAIRFLWAPYALWKDQIIETGKLRLELSKPEQMIQKHMAKQRAKARLKLIKKIHRWQSLYYKPESEINSLRVDAMGNSILTMCDEAGLPRLFAEVLYRLADECAAAYRGEKEHSIEFDIIADIQRYLNGDITIETLENLWPQDTVKETPL